MKKIGYLAVFLTSSLALFLFSNSVSASGIFSNISTDGIVSDSARVTFETNIAASCKIEYNFSGGSMSSIKQSPTEIMYNQGVRHVYLNDLKPDTQYFYSLSCTDRNGATYGTESLNSSGINNYSFFTKKAVIENIIKDVDSDNITINTAQINFTTTIPTDCRVTYNFVGGSINDIKDSVTEGVYNTSHKIVIKNLMSGTKYYYSLDCKDVKENNYGTPSINSSGIDNYSFSTTVMGSYSKNVNNNFVQIKGYPAVYWLSADNKRYLFSNRNVFSSWFGDNFNGLKVVSQNSFNNIQPAGNLTVKPGNYIKFDNSNIVYYVKYDNNICRVGSTPPSSVYLIQASFEADYKVAENCQN